MKQVATIAVRQGGKLLLGRRRDNGKWTTPGGHLDPGEKPLAGAVRELLEETGLKVKASQLKPLESREVKPGLLVHGFLYEPSGEVKTTMADDPDLEVKRWHFVDPAAIEDKDLHVPRKNNVLLPLMEKSAMNHFWNGFEKRASQEKVAVPWLAGLAHVAQNKVMSSLMRRDFFGKHLGRHFTEGLLNKKPAALKNFLSSAVSGATVPEVSLLQSHVRGLGNHVREGLVANGVTHLAPHDLEAIQHAIKGDMLSARRASPNISRATEGLLKDHPLYQDIQHRIRRLASDPNHPLASNIAAKLVQPAANKGKNAVSIAGAAVDPGHHANLAGGLLGSAALSVADPWTGALNASKMLSGNEAGRKFISKLPLGEKALKTVDKIVVKNPVESAYRQGLSNKKPSRVRDFFNRYGLNAVTAEAEHTANHVGQQTSQMMGNAFKPATSSPSVNQAYGLAQPMRRSAT